MESRACLSFFVGVKRSSRSNQAAGEAEAELAYLSHIGMLDAVMTDDVDTLLFGANMVITK